MTANRESAEGRLAAGEWRISANMPSMASTDSSVETTDGRMLHVFWFNPTVNAFLIAWASAPESPKGTNGFGDKWAISGIPPTLVATNGVPQAVASTRTLGIPSE